MDEIGDMPLKLQTLLLRVLEQYSIIRIAGKDEIPIDNRIIAATNKNLIRGQKGEISGEIILPSECNYTASHTPAATQ